MQRPLIKAAAYLGGVVVAAGTFAIVEKLGISDSAKSTIEAVIIVGLFIVFAAWAVVYYRDHDDSR